ncbi:MlaD family protein [Sciscionella marina]|uniref:MlaD family protein n=1 Tax=Sciscionella marina TaxID=508770 RepID=UPI0003683D2F|nr:MlaD family protein [Sciscionella marina]
MSSLSLRRSRLRLLAVIAFVVACLVLIGYLWTQAGGTIPGVSSTDEGYRVSADINDVDNLVPFADVEAAGINVGKVTSIHHVGRSARVEFSVNPEVAPLHQGATIQVSEKSLVGQPYIRLTDGHGQVVPSGTVLPASSVKPSVQLHDVLASLDAPTRGALRDTVRSLSAGTRGTHTDLHQLVDGLGRLGASGSTALDAIAAQSEDLKGLARQLPVALDALNSGQDDLGKLVDSADQLAKATSGQRADLEQTVRLLPGTLGKVRTASGKLGQLSGSLAPVVSNLRTAAPALSSALRQLPGTTSELRAMLPALNGTLDRAPATLNRIPTVAGDLNAALPQLRERLRDLNPMLRYLSPYGKDIGSFVANFGSSFAHTTTNGDNVLDLFTVANEQSVRGNPLNLGKGIFTQSNPYPAPGEQSHLGPFNGKFPRLVKDPE